jgi:sterol desaturase/sphingolipid hydroxylase (fatty acid hydroxylase superfamily)
MRRLAVPAMAIVLAAQLVGALVLLKLRLPASTEHHALVHAALPAWHTWVSTVLNPVYWAVLAGLSLLQWVFPAQRDHRRPSRELLQDGFWFLLSTGLQVTVVAAFLALLSDGYDHATRGWALDLTPFLGVWGVAVFAFVLSDGLAWLSHWLHHHTRVLWYFHAVHHSQENLNVLSDNRQHVIETMVAAAISYVPAVLLGLTSPQAIGLSFITVYFSAFIHANVRTDLGPLRFVFISPQAHRVHHSAFPEHFNSNYATIFAFWDYLFGTRHHDRDTYPATGIDDPTFPHPVKADPLSLVSVWARQSIHPFALAARGVRGYAEGVGTNAVRE